MASVGDRQAWTVKHYLALLAGDQGLLERLGAEGEYSIPTPFEYPGRGTIEVRLTASGGRVRVSEGGGLLRYLESQGMDLSVDVVISKTVWHAAQEAGGRLGGGEVFCECAPGEVPTFLARFTQVLLEVVGLRHCKYKDAIVKLERGSNFDDPFAPPTNF